MATASSLSFDERKILLAEVALTANVTAPEYEGHSTVHLIDPVARRYLYSTGMLLGGWGELKVPVFTSRTMSLVWHTSEGGRLPSAGYLGYEFATFRPLLPEIPECRWYIWVDGPRYWEF